MVRAWRAVRWLECWWFKSKRFLKAVASLDFSFCDIPTIILIETRFDYSKSFHTIDFHKIEAKNYTVVIPIKVVDDDSKAEAG